MSEGMMDPWELMKLGQYKEAIAIYTQQYEKDENRIWLHNRGLGYLLLQKYELALADFERILATSESGEMADSTHIYIGICYWYLDQPSEALTIWQKGLDAPFTDAAGGVKLPALLLYASERLNNQQLCERALKLLKNYWIDYQNYRDKQQRHQLISYEDFKHPGLATWPGVIVPYLLGKVNSANVNQHAQAAKHPILQERRQCEADFYIALVALRNGERSRFETKIKQCAQSLHGLLEHEYYLARWEIEHEFPATVDL